MPQPDEETFTFSFVEPAYVDSVWVGTRCIPEPATMSVLALGGLALIRRRKA